MNRSVAGGAIVLSLASQYVWKGIINNRTQSGYLDNVVGNGCLRYSNEAQRPQALSSW